MINQNLQEQCNTEMYSKKLFIFYYANNRFEKCNKNEKYMEHEGHTTYSSNCSSLTKRSFQRICRSLHVAGIKV